MKKLHGFVLVKETNNGIPKLVVSAYDAEINLRDLIIDSTEGWPASITSSWRDWVNALALY